MSSDEITTAYTANPETRVLAATLIDWLRERIAHRDQPLFVGLDGRSAAGKSTLAALVAQEFAVTQGDRGFVTVIESDEFYAGGSGEAWDRKTAAEKADEVIDWRRQRVALTQLRQYGIAEWQAFDWEAENWDSDTVPLASPATVTRSAPVTVLEGAYSCRPELHHLLDARILLDVPRSVRRKQLLDREGYDYQAEWEARWTEAENHYFREVMPPEHFDLVLDLKRVAS